MSDPLNYTLSLFAGKGPGFAASLQYSLVGDRNNAGSKNIDSHELSSRIGEIQVETFSATGTFASAGIDGGHPVQVHGSAYVSEYGPPITTILVSEDWPAVSLQFNFVDSAGQQIGGFITITQGVGAGVITETWAFLGTAAA